MSEKQAEQWDGLKVLSLGMSRTGTASMKEALHILGHKKVYHGYELYTNPSHGYSWVDAWDGKIGANGKKPYTKQQWNKLLHGYTAVTDMPSVCFGEEFIHHYPDAKVVLVERDEDAWMKSFQSGIIDNYYDVEVAAKISAVLDHKYMRPVLLIWQRLFATKEGPFHATTNAEMSASARQVYREHNATIKRITPPERLLLYSLKDGWEPLCKFLGEPIPQQLFPQINEGDAVKEAVEAFTRQSMQRAILNLSLGVLALSGVGYAIYTQYA